MIRRFSLLFYRPSISSNVQPLFQFSSEVSVNLSLRRNALHTKNRERTGFSVPLIFVSPKLSPSFMSSYIVVYLWKTQVLPKQQATSASAAGVQAVDNTVPYGMAKAAIISLTRSAAKELGQYGITTNCFLPVIKSEALPAGLDATSKEQQDAYVAAMIPLKYLGTAFEDCAPALVFMASEEARYFNGQVVGVDGGLVSLV